ncbi:MAG: hypothetical protein N3F04_02155 [Candidatus Nezhaarchaeota archaeon]|nr:hypothetical protein [Candidatus Nezhaarchaeota archaeon]MCX8141582.1 hypothetical protein [Candidatus Nezhaarchaeota archaeon]MDW8049849.1 hypothetical protein [Nitrososphaerota archaeon]
MDGLEQQHYSKLEVKQEITKFAKDRWVGIHCIKKYVKGDRVMARYLNKKPITISTPDDIDILWQELKGIRSIYATAIKYHKISSINDVKSITNMSSCTPTWDVDNDFKHWKSTIDSCLEIVGALKDEGVEKSVYIKWSGDGAHVHLHENSLTYKSLKGRTPLDVAYAIVEYIRLKVEPRVQEIAVRDNCTLKVENKMDVQRMFTCPLSLHRDHDRVCICMKPSALYYFNPSWVNPNAYNHDGRWQSYEEGEADELAEKALNVIGGFPAKKARARRFPRVDEMIVKWLKTINGI